MTYAASVPLPEPIEEMQLAGFLRQSPVDMVQCQTSEIWVPANAEMVLEGYLEPGEMRREGAFGNHTGFYAPAAPAAGLLQAAARAAAPGTVEVDEEAHWQQIFQDFLRTRASCGEPTEGLTYEKFRLKLEGNKAALVAKYACKSVKFQVYVKDGKAALKATPVK